MILKNAIALTGGIGTGKSTTASLLESQGYKVLDADKIAHQLLQEQRLVIAKHFGLDILENDILDRKKLGAIVFSDKTKLEWLEKFLHPLIREMMLKEALLLDTLNKPYFLDIPLFFEVGGKEHYPVSKVVLIYTPRALQIKRILERDKLKEVKILQRLECQMDIEQKRLMSDYVIDNSSSLKDLQHHLECFLKTLL
ncbi:dephospho-CoA kinase [Helicobacter cetorum]|uniref:Dephospho-CoA kinase n=1 Tax=Helicobacter cetorum (strain ATCC BAA-540 / CCUG 52418 / MIT 99-5656) TaxID=1163745 RepID=I0EQY5_HELCM|nr:dephospho-CoA kinase [Helicobacter cetorum]AFI05354.1 dephospho-CoA kinase [Helicobacter cetorum MIT 99-5656]